MPFPLAEALGIELPRLHVVDVGASMVEGEDHYAPLVRRGLCTVTGFEPDPQQLAALEASGRPGYRYLPHALGQGGPARFHVARFPGCSSLLPPDVESLDRFTSIGGRLPRGNFATIRQEPIETRRLDDVPELEPPDYIKLDIQGVERDVLRHGQRTLRSALVVESEVLFASLYEGQGDFADLTVELRGQGFELYEIRDVHRCSVAPFLMGGRSFAARGQWMWADAVYIRRWVDLSGWPTESLLKTATILHEVYEAYDLVHHFLIEAHLRLEVPLADRYRAAMAKDPALVRDYPVARAGWDKALSPARQARSAGRSA